MGLLNNICKDENVKIIGLTEELMEILTGNCNFTGCGYAVAQGNEKYIFYDTTASIWEKRFTVAHEAAHHLLGHLRPNATISPQDRENEANIFAAIITAMILFKEYENKID